MSNESRKKSILVIDDDERVLMALECFLETEGYETTTAWSGHEALDLLRSRKFDLVLLDDYLWDMEVEAILQQIRKMEIKPLVMLTGGLPVSGAMKRYIDLGATSCVWKWASCDEIATAVRQCFERKAFDRVLV